MGPLFSLAGWIATLATLQAITCEMRQFESVFLGPSRSGERVAARIFSMLEEVSFAGHPLLGAAALHDASEVDGSATWQIQLGARTVPIQSTRCDGYYIASMDQGKPEFGNTPRPDLRRSITAALGLKDSDLIASPEVVSTGLRYLIVPVSGGLSTARIADPGLGGLTAPSNARPTPHARRDVLSMQGAGLGVVPRTIRTLVGIRLAAAPPALTHTARTGLVESENISPPGDREGRWIRKPPARYRRRGSRPARRSPAARCDGVAWQFAAISASQSRRPHTIIHSNCACVPSRNVCRNVTMDSST
jgi:hypothetical protein